MAPRHTCRRRSLLLAALACAVAAACAPRGASAQLTPENYIASGDQCRAAGAASGAGAARDACRAAVDACARTLLGSSGPPATSIGAVSLPQCANVALGACQSAADVFSSPCAREARLGSGVCDAATFRSIYERRMTSGCYAAASRATGVVPGTNSWSGSPYARPSVGAVVSPGSVVGSAIGGAIAGQAGSYIGSAIGNGVDRAVVNTVFGRRMMMR